MSAFSIMLLVFGFVVLMKVTRHGRRSQWDWFDGRERALYQAELGEFDRRLAAVEQLEARVLELENRLDFAERLLSSRSESQSGG